MIKLGAHLSISGGYTKALDQIVAIGGNCLQIFSTSPRGWNLAKMDEVQTTEFAIKKSSLKIDPIYFHASYLINLADEGKIGHLSKLSLISELNMTPKLQIKGSVVHLGSFKDEKTEQKYYSLINHIKEILNETPADSLLIIENAGNKKIGQSLEEIKSIIDDVGSRRLRVCLDTCHLHSAGYDLSSPKKLNDFIKKFESLVGLKRLELFHFNDSKDPYQSGRDRHENIGQGTVPIDTFKLLMTHPQTKRLPFIIETPGFKNEGPDKKNLDILKSLLY